MVLTAGDKLPDKNSLHTIETMTTWKLEMINIQVIFLIYTTLKRDLAGSEFHPWWARWSIG